MKKDSRTYAFREYLKIDKNNLHQEIINQPVLYERIGREVAIMSGIVATKKEQFKEVDAELDTLYRKKFDRQGLRVTESSISSAILTDKRHKEAYKKYVDANKKYEKLLALKESFNQRSFMLRDLVQLYMSNYFSKETFKDDDVVKDFRQRKLKEARKAKRS